MMLLLSTFDTKYMSTDSASKPYHHGDLKNALIAAGLQLLRERGVAGLNLREVARIAGVSHTAPYRHFPDKQALISAIAVEGFEMLAAVIRAVDAQHYPTTVDRLAATGEAYVRFAIEHPAHIAIMFNRENTRGDDPELSKLSKVGFEYLVTHIHIGQNNGELPPMEPMEVAKCLWATLHGLAVLTIEGPFVLPEVPETDRLGVLVLAAKYVRVILVGGGKLSI
jgi:AcrR family transcriptional regulator